MHTLPRDEWMRLAKEEAEPSVTLMIDLEPANPDRRSVRLRMQHLCKEADRRLAELGIPEEKRRALLEPIWSKCDGESAVPRDSESLVALLSPSIQAIYPLQAKLTDRVEVSDHFVLSPLTVQLEEPEIWYLLTLSDDSARLLKVELGELKEVPLPLERKARAEANAEVVVPEPSGSLHTNRFSRGTGRGTIKGTPIAHPQGYGHEDITANERETWYRFVDQALTEVLAGTDAPLVLVADVLHHKPFYKICSHRGLLEQGVMRHPVSLTDRELQELGRELVRTGPEATKLSDRYFAARSDNRTTTSLEEALAAARNAQVDLLMWVPGPPQRDDQENDLLDELVRLTAIHGGTVQAVTVEALPERGEGLFVNAILRWPLER